MLCFRSIFWMFKITLGFVSSIAIQIWRGMLGPKYVRAKIYVPPNTSRKNHNVTTLNKCKVQSRNKKRNNSYAAKYSLNIPWIFVGYQKMVLGNDICEIVQAVLMFFVPISAFFRNNFWFLTNFKIWLILNVYEPIPITFNLLNGIEILNFRYGSHVLIATPNWYVIHDFFVKIVK